MDQFPVLYILMRTDLQSMNPGKAMAQASHASNAFMRTIKLKKAQFVTGNGSEEDRKKISLADLWEGETPQGFGTVIVLGVNEKDLRDTITMSHLVDDVVGDIIHDPTYPLVDGDIVHYLPLDTCGYVFLDKNNPITDFLVGRFPLHQ